MMSPEALKKLERVEVGSQGFKRDNELIFGIRPEIDILLSD